MWPQSKEDIPNEDHDLSWSKLNRFSARATKEFRPLDESVVRSITLREHRSIQYGVIAILAGFLVRVIFWSIWEGHYPLITSFPVVLVVAYYGGLVPGLTVTLLGMLGGLALSFAQPAAVNTLFPNVSIFTIYLVYCTLVSWLGELQLRAVDRANSEALIARKAEARIRDDERRFRVLAESLPQLIWTTRADGYCDYLSKQWCEYTGVAESLQLGSGWLEFVHPDDRERVKERWQLSVQSTVVFEIDYRIRAANGDYRWFKTGAIPVRDETGGITQWVGSNTDIEEVKRAEETARQFKDELELRVTQRTEELSRTVQALRDSEERFRLLIDGVKDYAICRLDPAGRVATWNAGAERTMGYTAEEIIGQHFSIFHPPTDIHTGQADLELNQALQEGRYEDVRERVRKGGETFWSEITLTPLFDATGKHQGFAKVTRNITDRKRADEELRRAKRLAEAANRAKSDFLANMSHEIRTPMNGIMGMTALVLDTELTPLQREFLSTVKSSADSLLTVINDILDYSKIEAGKLDLDPQPFSLRESLGDLLKPLAYRAQCKNLELVCRIDPNIPDAYVGDVGRLRQILVNLIGNALKFTHSGDVFVDVQEMGDSTAKGRLLHFSVSDTGIGISASKLASIFEPFVQADASMTRVYGGTGLGLAISSQIVALMGGNIWAVSQPGVGSTFHFTITLEVSPPWESSLPIKLPPSKLLLAVSNSQSSKVLNELLINWGAQCVLARNLQQVIHEAGNAGEPFSAIILDTSLPGMEDAPLRQQLAGVSQGSTKIVLLVGDPERGRICREDFGPGPILSKPPKQSELWDALRERQASRQTLRVEGTGSPRDRKTMNLLRVLLAEDNAVNARLARYLLEKQGHQVTVVGTGLAAVEAVENLEFDVVLMDMQMPEMDGLDATIAIRQREQVTGKHIKVIAWTANAMTGDREKCLAAGMDGYITKPLVPQHLFDALEEIEMSV